MPKRVSLDGKIYEFPDDFTDEEISQALTLEVQPPASPVVEEPSLLRKIGMATEDAGEALAGSLPQGVQEFLGEKLKDIGFSADPETNRDILTKLPLLRMLGQKVGSFDEANETLPAIGGALGAMAGGTLGAMGGSVAGEGVRQGVNEMMGRPVATGLVQQATGMDPNSPEAMATGYGAEAAAAGLGGVLSKLSDPLIRAARRSTQNLVQLPDDVLAQELKRGPRTKGEEVLDRAVEEGLAPIGSTRQTQRQLAREKLKEADSALSSLKETEGELMLDEGKLNNLVKTLEEGVPPPRPGGTPQAGRTAEVNAQKVLDDANSFIMELSDTEGGVSVKRALAEKSRLQNEISNLLEGGGEAPLAKKAMMKASEAWNDAITGSFPELGDASLRVSDLITLNKYIQRAYSKAKFQGADLGSEGVAAGAAAGGRYSIPLMVLGKASALATAGPLSSTSGAIKRLGARITSDPKLMQEWVRLMSQLRPEEDTNE